MRPLRIRRRRGKVLEAEAGGVKRADQLVRRSNQGGQSAEGKTQSELLDLFGRSWGGAEVRTRRLGGAVRKVLRLPFREPHLLSWEVRSNQLQSHDPPIVCQPREPSLDHFLDPLLWKEAKERVCADQIEGAGGVGRQGRDVV